MTSGSPGRRAVLIAILAGVGAYPTSACDRGGLNAETPVRIAWTVPLADSDASWIGFPAAVGGLFIAETGDALRAFDAASGRTVWRTQLRTGVPLGTENVAVAAGRVFAAGGDSVYALDAASGRRLWAFLPDAQAALAVSAADSHAVYLGTRSHRVYALTAATGAELWSVDLGAAWPYLGIVNGLAVSGDTVYANVMQYLNAAGGLRTGHVVALHRTTGAELWRYVGPGAHNDATQAPRVAGRFLLIANVYAQGSDSGSFFALDRFTGDVVWRVTTGGIGPGEAPRERDGIVYVGAGDTRVYAVDLVSGVQRWSRMTGGSVDAVELCGRALLVNNLELRVLDPATGRQSQAILDGADFPTSAFATSGARAFVVGNHAAYGLECLQ